MSLGTSLEVQWLRFRASTTGGARSIPGRGTKIPYAVRGGQKLIIIIVVPQHCFINCHKGTILMQDVKSRATWHLEY